MSITPITGRLTDVRPVLSDPQQVWVTVDGGGGTFSMASRRNPTVGDEITIHVDRGCCIRQIDFKGQSWCPQVEE